MSRTRWHVMREGDRLTLSRRGGRLAFDVVVERRLPMAPLSREALAQQIRQDVWRALRDQPGFSPVVEVTREDAGLTVRAGGTVAAAHPRARLEERVAAVLDDPARRARWCAHAGRRALRKERAA